MLSSLVFLKDSGDSIWLSFGIMLTLLDCAETGNSLGDP